MFNKSLNNKIDKFLKNNFDIIYKYDFDGLVFLWGDTLKQIIMNEQVNKLEFLILNQDNNNILSFFKKYKLKYDVVNDYEYNVIYKDLFINIKLKNDLIFDLSTDYLFYDIDRKQFIPVGIKQTIDNRKITWFCNKKLTSNNKKNIRSRLILAKKFVQFLSNNNKKVKIVRK